MVVRDKNPKIRPDAKGRYNRKIVDPGSGRSVLIIYDACLIDSEDIELVKCTDGIESHNDAWHRDIQARIDDIDQTLRAELAEYADYTEAHS